MPSKEEMREASMAKIMETALELFAIQGFHSTSMNKIAKKAGVSKGLIYNYFESKDDLLFAIVNHAVEVGEQIFDAYKDISNPRESLTTMIHLAFLTLKEQAHYWKLMTELMLQEDVMAKVKNLLAGNMKETLETVEALFTAMGSETPLIDTRMLLATLDGISLHYLFAFEEYPLKEMEQRVLKQFIL